MLKNPNGATGEAVSAVTRRSFLRSTATAGIATITAGSALAVQGASAASLDAEFDAALPARLDAALSDYLVEAREITRLLKAWNAASDSLPAWARTGPNSLLHDGSKGGALVVWPEMKELPLPPQESGGATIIRPSPRQFWRERQQALRGKIEIISHEDGTITIPKAQSLTGEARRKERLAMIGEMRTIMARVREQRNLRRAAGLPAFQAALDASTDRMNALDDRLEALAQGSSPAAIAVVALLQRKFNQDDFSLSLLKRTAPHLTGLLRVVVDDMIANGQRDIDSTILQRGAAGAT